VLFNRYAELHEQKNKKGCNRSPSSLYTRQLVSSKLLAQRVLAFTLMATDANLVSI